MQNAAQSICWEALKKVDRFYEAGIHMNGQIVLCKGVNDGAELDFSIRELTKYLPVPAKCFCRSGWAVKVSGRAFSAGTF